MSLPLEAWFGGDGWEGVYENCYWYTLSTSFIGTAGDFTVMMLLATRLALSCPIG